MSMEYMECIWSEFRNRNDENKIKKQKIKQSYFQNIPRITE